MIRIFFKTIWNNRRRNILVFIELFVISLFLVNVTVYLVNMISIIRIKNCYDPHNVIIIWLSKKGSEDKVVTEQSFYNLKMKLTSNKLVESVSFCANATPFNFSMSSWGFKYGNEKISMGNRSVDIDYGKVMKITPLKGRWFNETDIGKSVKPVLISNDLEKKYFGGDAIGKRFGEDPNMFEIIGIVDPFKRSDIEKPYSFGFFFDVMPTWGGTVLVRSKEDKVKDLLSIAEIEVYSVLDPTVWIISGLNSLENIRNKQNYDSAQRHYLSLIIAIFIMINVFLGVIGILWYNTNLRIHEIGIKRALGATGRGITRMLLTENMFLAGLGLLIVVLIFLQVPAFTGGGKTEPGVFTLSIWISVITMLILVLLSTWIPTFVASKIRPATALKTE